MRMDLDARAGYQGIVFGYATDENEDTAPLTHMITNRLGKRLSDVRKNDDLRWFRPHGETQIIDFPVIMQRQVAAVQVAREIVKLPQTLLIDSTEDISSCATDLVAHSTNCSEDQGDSTVAVY